MGYLLFEDPEIGYFANDRIDSKLYWYLPQSQLDQLKSIKKKTPTAGSLAFTDTKYFIMREGWELNDKMMIISAGVDDKNPQGNKAHVPNA